MPKPLSGLLVVSIDQAVAAPLCAMRLADAGARVIKVERPEGDFARGYDRFVNGLSANFVWLNRGKESIALDFRRPADRDLLGRMIAKADVFIQNLAPGAAARAGFGSAELRARHPRLITCDISGYGEDGPYAEMKAYDFLVQAETGLVSVTGTPEAMGRVGVSVCDIAAGLNAYAAVLEALLRRSSGGQGSAIKVSLFDGMADWMSVPLLQHDYTGKGPPRIGLNHPTIAPYGAYRTGGGGMLVLSVQNQREWSRFCREVIERPELETDPRFHDTPARVANRPALNAEIEAAFAQHGRDRIAARLAKAQIAYGAIRSIAEFSRHPQLRRIAIESEAGTLNLVAPPAQVAGEAPPDGRIPALDQHGAALRKEFAAD